MRIFASASVSPVAARWWAAPIAPLVLLFAAHSAPAQSLGYEGSSGVFVTPLAATATSPAHGAGHPVVSYHLLDGGPVIGTWSTVSFTEGFARRFEVGYARQDHAAGNNAALSGLWTDGLNIFHGKAVVVQENAGKTKWIPGIAIGGIARTNDSNVGDGTNSQTKVNGDIYLVATKIVTQTGKIPLVLNAGVRGTNASLWGLGGNAQGWEARAFGALGFVITGPHKSTIILASEAAQQPQRILFTSNSGAQSTNLDIPTSIVYAIRVVPFPEHKINFDAGILQAAGRVAPGVDLQARARFAFGVSYGF